jgi:hypothetical protein
MSIVSTTIISDETSGSRRMIRYRCTDSAGGTHDYGPLITVDPNFDAEAHKSTVAEKLAYVLAEQEADEVLQ